MSFTEYLRVPELAERYRKVKAWFFLRESAYDVTSRCQLRCDGCYYFEGDKSTLGDERDPERWRAFFADEKNRGITYVILAGAEPALVPQILRAAYETMPLGTVASNGLKLIPKDIGYRVHLSVWGDGEGDPKYRKYANGTAGPNCLDYQLKNYANDPRVVFAYTFNQENVDQVDEVVKRIADAGHKLTFNVFSSPEGRAFPLKLQDTLLRTREKMCEAIETYPETVLYSYYNAWVHTQPVGLHDLFGCPYPRAQRTTGHEGIGISQSFRNYRTNLTHDERGDCCIPDIDCADCRHYASGSAIVSSRLQQHVTSEQLFRGWLDYVDTYLSVWVAGYTRGTNLYTPSSQEGFAPRAPLLVAAGAPRD